jgi:hypothetical protein
MRMKHTFCITHEIDIAGQRGLSDILAIETETDFVPECPTFFPKLIAGRLLGLSDDCLARLRFASGVVVYVNTRRYIFEILEQDRGFSLRRDW